MRRLILPAVLLAAAACTVPDDSSDPNIATPPANGSSKATSKPAAKAKPKSDLRTITYRVAGSADAADLTYGTASGEEQQGDARLPWHKTFKVRRGEFAMLDISAQNKGSGTVTCEIDVDGRKVKAAKSSGQYAIVMCNHDLGF